MVLHSYAPDWTYEETKNRLLGIPEPHFKQFSVFLYVLGARINEGRAIRTDDIGVVDTATGKKMVVALPTEKNPHIERRNIPINPLTEKHYCQVVYEALKEAMTNKIEFPFKIFTERTYRNRIRTFLDIHPHALRHLRVHHIDDKTIPGMDALTPRQYQDYFGWETIATSSKYQSRTRSRDLAERF